MKTVVLCLLVGVALAAPSRKPTFRRGLSRIIGGQEATPGQFPYQLSIEDTYFGSGSHLCGATIYSNMYAITTGLCTLELMDWTDRLQVVAGQHKRHEVNDYVQKIPVSKVILHEDFDIYSNDIAIIYLSEPLKFNERVQPVPLQEEMGYAGNCVVSGWGRTETDGSLSSTLYYANITVISDELCQLTFDSMYVEDSMVCTRGNATCVEDLGGPLVCDGLLTGIATSSIQCYEPEVPGVYTEVAYFSDWIKENTK